MRAVGPSWKPQDTINSVRTPAAHDFDTACKCHWHIYIRSDQDQAQLWVATMFTRPGERKTSNEADIYYLFL